MGYTFFVTLTVILGSVASLMIGLLTLIAALPIAQAGLRPVVAERDLKAAQDKLLKSPDDPEANLTVGRHYAFVKDDWEKARSYLLKGKEKALAELVEKESDVMTDAYSLAQMADLWLKAGDKAGIWKQYYRDRTIFWLGKAWEAATAEYQTNTLRKRLDQLQASSARTPSAPGAAAGWRLWGGAQIGQKYVRTGKKSIALSQRLNKDKTGSGTQAEGPGVPIPAEAKGHPFFLTFYALTDDTELAGEVHLKVTDSTGQSAIDLNAPVLPNRPFWKKYVLSGTLPADALSFKIFINAQAEQGLMFVDDVSFVVNGQDLLKNGSFEN